MRPITRYELTSLIGDREGVALVDRKAQGSDRPSMLHSVTCRWIRKTGAATPLRFARSLTEATRWLRLERGGEGDGWQRCTECHATGPKQRDARGKRRTLPERGIAESIWTTDLERDLVWVTSTSADELEVAGFDSPSYDSVGHRRVRIEDTSRFFAGTGDRCFVEIDGEWRAAECAEPVTETRDVLRTIYRGERIEVPLARVRFRRMAPLEDPVGELSEHRSGRLDMFLARTDFLRRYFDLAAADRGLHGVVSSSVDLYPHQIGVARRILADPVQRYLLADEVGLGKTIEAGFVIRQRLIDAPRSVVVVLVPSALVWQWESELESKFGLSEFRHGGIEVVSYDDERAFDRTIAPDLVVVDEAHRVAAGWESDVAALSNRYEAARTLAHRVPRVLLLSATPVLHRERDLLAMLHLLDPDAYPLAAVDEFTARVRDRERIGELLLSLRPNVPEFLIRSRLPDLRDTFGMDNRMSAILDRVETSIGGDGVDREAPLADARSHVSETYRLHRRLLRNRRSSIEGTSFVVRGRGGAELVEDGDARRPRVDDWLEHWRTTLLEDAYERESEQFDKAMRAFVVWAACATGDLEALRDLVAFRGSLKRLFRVAAGLGPQEGAAVRRFERSDRQQAALDELLDVLGDEERHRQTRGAAIVEQLLKVEGQAVLVFASAPATVVALRDDLESRGMSAMEYAYFMSDAERRSNALEFVEGTGHRFLLCDATGEEGLNLQVADCIVHVDLPFSAMRIEQRIGRVDRHGEGPPVQSVLVDPGPSMGFGAWWVRALRDSFGVFQATTAPLQYAIETVEQDLLRTLFTEGIVEASTVLAEVRKRVEEEQTRIDKVDALDALARQETDDVQFVDRVRDLEEGLGGTFALAVKRSIEVHRSSLGAEVSKLAQGGHVVSLTLEPPPTHVFGALRERDIRATADRHLAVRQSSLSLLRPGSPLVELIRLQQDWDDRSQSAAVWSLDPHRDDDLIAVRCDLLVMADTDRAFATWRNLEAGRPRTARAMRTDADAPLAQAALQRRLHSYLAPKVISLWFDRDMELIADAHLVEELEERLAATTSLEWPKPLWQEAAQSLGVLSLADFLKPIAQRAQDAALERLGLQTTLDEAVRRAEHDASENERQLRLRAEISVESRPAERDLQAERSVSDALIESLRCPRAHWSGACMLWISPREPLR